METDSACVEIIITFVSNINTSQYTNCSQLLKLCRLRVVKWLHSVESWLRCDFFKITYNLLGRKNNLHN